jgi:uncharacterized DUF497 family protein
MEIITLESLLHHATHGIGDVYKDSEAALYEKECESEENADVEVLDRRRDTGKILHFIWDRKKSNDNVDDIRLGKRGFSFYYARYLYRDAYILECPELAKGLNNTAFIGMIEEEDDEEDVLLVIQAKHEEKNRIRIISSYYKEDYNLLKRYTKHIKRLNRSGTFHKNTIVYDDGDPDRLKKAWEGYHRRQVAFEEAQKNK